MFQEQHYNYMMMKGFLWMIWYTNDHLAKKNPAQFA